MITSDGRFIFNVHMTKTAYSAVVFVDCTGSTLLCRMEMPSQNCRKFWIYFYMLKANLVCWF